MNLIDTIGNYQIFNTGHSSNKYEVYLVRNKRKILKYRCSNEDEARKFVEQTLKIGIRFNTLSNITRKI